ncbi:MAG: hypothetical protein J7639_17170 [Paenibacillaceae bacterium]|nr:hypothetical protein [Paenibacillaceae bacterium]
MTSTVEDRRKELLLAAAEEAKRLPLLASGFWFHGDVRDNLYFALHLYAACAEGLLDEAEAARSEELAIDMLRRVLSLQNRDKGDAMYGHWPLGLAPDPWQAKPHALPVELAGCLLALFERRYRDSATTEARAALWSEINEACRHIYEAGAYRKALIHYGHHDAKYIAQQLIWGARFGDGALLAEGRQHLEQLLAYIDEWGRWEYGSLPWFWHWVQSFACAAELVEDEAIAAGLDDVLRFLWSERVLYYWRGAWVGPHNRVLPHDVPLDRNHLFDYVQFGDFPLPRRFDRLEAAGLLRREAPADIRAAAVRAGSEVSEAKVRIPLPPPREREGARHAYVYKTAAYALGGMWERAEEYANEQHRWDVTVAGGAQLFFFPPGEGWRAGDPRHATEHGEVLLHRGVAAALYPLPAEAATPLLVGCLPQGEWVRRERLLAGRVGDAWLVVHLLRDIGTWTERDGWIEVTCEGASHGVVVEALGAAEAAALGCASVGALADAAAARAPRFAAEAGDGGGPRATLGVAYTSFGGADLALRTDSAGALAERTIDGASVDWAAYRIHRS